MWTKTEESRDCSDWNEEHTEVFAKAITVWIPNEKTVHPVKNQNQDQNKKQNRHLQNGCRFFDIFLKEWKEKAGDSPNQQKKCYSSSAISSTFWESSFRLPSLKGEGMPAVSKRASKDFCPPVFKKVR